MTLLTPLVLCVAAAHAVAQPDASPPVPVDPFDITGDGFGPVVLVAPGTPPVATLRLAGGRARLWSDRPLRAGVETTRRVYLQGDVRASVGTLEVSADAAHGWFQRLPDGRQQFFLVLEDALIPTGSPGSGVSGPLLPIEGVLAAGSTLALSAITVERESPLAATTAVAQSRFAQRLRESVGLALPVADTQTLADEDAALRSLLDSAQLRLGGLPTREPILPTRGRVWFDAAGVQQMLVRQAAEGERPEYAVVLDGPVIVQFQDTQGGRRAQLTARDAVLFHEADLGGLRRLDAADVAGLYLEGDVTVDIEIDRRGGAERYRVRSPRVYYDLREDRALLIEAVFRADPPDWPTPIFVRAGEIRQRSLREFTATDAQLTNTGFFRPHLALGASTVTVRSEPRPDRDRLIADARNITVRALDVPFLYWPVYVGDPTQIPLRRLAFQNSSRTGAAIRTAWDGFSLLGVEKPAGIDLDVLLDLYFERGPAFGGEVRWDGGDLFVYNLVSDSGTDQLTTGARIDRDDENRFIGLLQHIDQLDDLWTFRAEGAFFSDENVLSAFAPNLTSSRREAVTGGSLQRIDDASSLLVGTEFLTNDFLVSDYQLRSRGYIAERLPEARYIRPGDDLLPGVRPGLLTYGSDTRMGQLRLNFTEPTAAELGFDTPTRSMAAFGIAPSETLDDTLRAEGLTERSIFRFDTRHELSAQLDLGPVRVQPFVGGRVTAYDTEFEEFSDEADEARVRGTAGARLSTQLTRVYDGVDVPALDLYRLRHVVEPNATFWYADSEVPQGALPVYDEFVENVAEGFATRFGIDQTFQTKRGSTGAYESVDVLTLSTHLHFAGDERPDDDRIPRFFDANPERSQLGDAFDLRAAYQATDAVGLTFQYTYDLDLDRNAEIVGGFQIDHSPTTRLFGEVRHIGAPDDTYASAGAAYQLSDRYDIAVDGVYDADENSLQSIGASLSREIPNLVLTGRVRFNEITGETTVGVRLRPTVIDRRREALDRLGNSALGF
ncbi:MAG: hypothetical protein AAFX79_02835 [Planctomycetota bacterium]